MKKNPNIYNSENFIKFSSQKFNSGKLKIQNDTIFPILSEKPTYIILERQSFIAL